MTLDERYGPAHSVRLTPGGRLIEPGLMEDFFKVAFRDARYLHRLTGKFHLYLLTVLRPVGT